MDQRNWAGNYTYRAQSLHQPVTIEEVRSVVADAERIHVLGSRHSFNEIADSTALLSLQALPPDVVVDRSAGTVTFNAGMRYGDLAETLDREGLALHNLASLPHISVAGAISTATHGSGVGNGNLATAVAALELVTSSGDSVHLARNDRDFAGAVVGLGALGAVVRLTLDVEPAFEVRQYVFEGLDWDVLFADFEKVIGAGYSVSLFTRWGDRVEQVWLKRRDDARAPAPEPIGEEFFGARAATVERHPILELTAESCTPQLGVSGLWSDRLPHFRMGFTPSSGEEIQSEFFVPRRFAVEALQTVRSLHDEIASALLVSEIRAVAADDLWMSPEYGQQVIALHFTWRRDDEAVGRVVRVIEDGLEPFAARPHWGKVFFAEAPSIARLYERLPDFVALAERLDPRHAFRNEWLERVVFGGCVERLF